MLHTQLTVSKPTDKDCLAATTNNAWWPLWLVLTDCTTTALWGTEGCMTDYGRYCVSMGECERYLIYGIPIEIGLVSSRAWNIIFFTCLTKKIRFSMQVIYDLDGNFAKNLLAWQAVLFAPGHQAKGYVNPDYGTLTHWGRVTQTCVSKFTIIGSDNGLSPIRRQAIIWTNDGILLIRTLGTNFSEILIQIHTFSNKKMHLKMSSGKCWPFCLGLNVLTHCGVGLPCNIGDLNFEVKYLEIWKYIKWMEGRTDGHQHKQGQSYSHIQLIW